jgi:hypothetical protein
MLEHEVRELQQHFLARLRRLVGPASFLESRARGGYRAVDVGFIAGRDGTERLAVGGIEIIECGAARRRGEASVDEHLRAGLERGGAGTPFGSCDVFGHD